MSVATGASHVPALAPPAGAMGPRRALVLAGGGMRVAYQAGVVRALAESGLRFAHADGTSGGTMNLAMMLSGLTPAEMCDRWVQLDPREFAALLPLRDYLRGRGLIAFGGGQGVENRVFPALGIDLEQIRAAEGMVGTFNVCNFTRKTSEVWEHRELEEPLLLAGVSLPIFMPPVRFRGSLYTDSVWIRDANLMEAVRRGAEEIWLVWCIGNSPAYRQGAFNQYVHMIELSANGRLFEELAAIAELNRERERPIRLHVVRPRVPLPLDPDYFRGRIDGATLVAMGQRDAWEYLARARPEGVPLAPEVTAMRDPEPGVAVRRRLRGSLRWAASEVDEPAELELAARLDGVGRALADPSAVWPLHGMLTVRGRGLRAFTSGGDWRPGGDAGWGPVELRPGDGPVRLVVEPSGAAELRAAGGVPLAAGRLTSPWFESARSLLGTRTFGARTLIERLALLKDYWAVRRRGSAGSLDSSRPVAGD